MAFPKPPTDDELEKVQEAAEWAAMDIDPHAINAEVDSAGRRAVFELGRKYERAYVAEVKAAAQRMAVVFASLNKKLAEWPEEDGNG
jgi:hypothetical protein